MKRLRWLTVPAVRAIHQELIARYGGLAGLRDEGLLESALARPRHLVAYGRDASISRLAAAYAWGLLRNHPFVDGNKRAALAALVVFLDLNCLELTCPEAEEAAVILEAAEEKITEADLSQWVRRRSKGKE